ncbi:MAG: aldo/keto reductase [Clostridia bacterium]|nr:aldo/keto reductase [Clostridia bacterium]
MQYRVFPKINAKSSVLGFGCMRLPVQDTENHPIDRPEAITMLRYAIDNGLTYVDTAYGYHNEESEVVVGLALQDGYREKVNLATKLPLWKVETYEDMEKLLDTQLGRLQTDHVDFYLLHACNRNSFAKVKELGAFKFLEDMKSKGKIKYAGFSFHDDADCFREIIDSYDWDFCQVQMNVLDEFNQATMDGVRYAASKNIGLIVMEPLRGGALTVRMPEEIKEVYKKSAYERTEAEWAFRWVYDKPEFIVILSGMSTWDQVKENMAIFDKAEANCLKDDEKETLTNIRKAYEARIRVGCTGCEYCVAGCPAEIKIPEIFRPYDNAAMFDTLPRFYENYRKNIGENKCLQCGACEASCPQKIEIRKWLEIIDNEAKA